MICTSRLVAVGLLLSAVPAFAADGKYTIKTRDLPAPKELAEPIRKLMSEQAVQLLDSKGTVLCDVWFRKNLAVKATAEQLKNGLTYHDLEESTLLGAVRVEQRLSDYRKHKVKPGVYTLRLGFQPMDGDHMGTAPYSEFCLVLASKSDVKPNPLETKQLQEMSAKAIGGSHPGVFLLFPNEKPLPTPQLVEKENHQWVLMAKVPVSAPGQKGSAGLGIGLTLIGHSTAE